MAAGALELEEQVSEYIVEPLVELVAPELVLEPQAHIDGAGIADYLVREGDVEGPARCVIEVKQSIDLSKGAHIEASRAFGQLRRYQKAVDLPGVLIDAHRVVGVSREGSVIFDYPRADFDR
ncbi:MAG: hypothetical protein LC118_18395, partial [Dehalococcoidia bacterium]|nr:hypothetical protein [Dehalococcoidia bacterium]